MLAQPASSLFQGCRAAALLLLLLGFNLPAHAQVEHVVLLINSYHAEYSWVKDYTRALEEQLGKHVSLTSFDMNTKHTPPSLHQMRAQRAWDMFLGIRPELVIVGDDNALKLLGERIIETGVPLVYLGINNNPRAYLPSHHNLATGVLERPLFKRNIASMRNIFGKDFDKCLLLFDLTTTSAVLLQQVFRGRMSTMISGVATDIRLTNDWDEWRRLVLGARDKGYDAIIIGLYQSLRDGERPVADIDALRWTSANAPVPPLAFWDFTIGPGLAVGGLALQGQEQGRAAGIIVNRILAGESPADISPVTPEQGVLLFSREGLRKWGIDIAPAMEPSVTYTD